MESAHSSFVAIPFSNTPSQSGEIDLSEVTETILSGGHKSEKDDLYNVIIKQFEKAGSQLYDESQEKRISAIGVNKMSVAQAITQLTYAVSMMSDEPNGKLVVDEQLNMKETLNQEPKLAKSCFLSTKFENDKEKQQIVEKPEDEPTKKINDPDKITEKLILAEKLTAENIKLSQDIQESKQTVTELHARLQKSNQSYPGNKKLLEEVNSKEKTILELATQFEELRKNFSEKEEEVHRLKRERITAQLALKRNSLSPEVLMETASQEPHSLPTPVAAGENTKTNMQALESKINSYKAQIKELKDMNVQWQLYDRRKEEIVKNLKVKIKQQTDEINRLNSQMSSESSDSLSFTPVQQEYIDQFYQRLRRDTDRMKEQLDSTVSDAQQNVTTAKRKQEDAEKKAEDLQKQVEDLEGQIALMIGQTEELRTALVVATRSQIQRPSHHEQDLINTLREAARQYEDDYRRANSDYQRVLAENTRLVDQLRQRRPFVRQMIVNHHGGGTTTIERTTDDVSPTFDDLEADY